MAVQLDAAGAGGGDEAGGDARVARQGDDRRLAVARHAGDADLRRIDARIRIGLEVIDQATHAPGPRTQRAPVVGTARLPLVAQADDALAQSVAVALDAVGVDRAVAPALV